MTSQTYGRPPAPASGRTPGGGPRTGAAGHLPLAIRLAARPRLTFFLIALYVLAFWAAIGLAVWALAMS